MRPLNPLSSSTRAMARRYWPDGHAIGARIKTTDDRPDAVPWLTVVGVVGDVRQMGLDAPVSPEMYVPYRPVRFAAVVHAAGTSSSERPAIRHVS